MVRRLFQFVVSAAGMFLSLYIVLSILLFKPLRQLQYFLILLQAVADFFGNGLGGLWLYLQWMNSQTHSFATVPASGLQVSSLDRVTLARLLKLIFTTFTSLPQW